LDGTIRLWDALTGQALGKPLLGHEDGVSSVCYSPDGRILAGGSNDSIVLLWDASTGKPRGKISLPPRRSEFCIEFGDESVTCVDISSNGTVAIGSTDNVIHLWDASTGEFLCEPLGGHRSIVTSVSFSPDGRTLASGSNDSTVRLWDAFTGEPLGEPLYGHEETVTSVCFSSDGRTLVSASEDHTIILWDVSTGKPIGEPLRGHGSGVTSVRFSSDGRTLVSGSMDHKIRVWDGVPRLERIGYIRGTLESMEKVRSYLADQIARTGESLEDVAGLQASVLADPRLSGELRRIALLVVGEVSLNRHQRVEHRVTGAQRALERTLKHAWERRLVEDWRQAIAVGVQVSEEDLAEFDATMLNELAWEFLTADPADSPTRDLCALLRWAERAVDRSRRADGAILHTLARAHWEFGDKPKALAVQTEAIQTLEAQVAGAVDAQRREALAKLLPELRDTLARYERDEPPARATTK
jgi:hypothetical protein